MTKVHTKQLQPTTHGARNPRFGKCICAAIAAVTMIRCAQANADGSATTARSAAAGDAGYHRTFDRNTDLATLSFTRMPIAGSDFSLPLTSERPLELTTPEMHEVPAYSDRDFRPRRRTMFDASSSLAFDSPGALHSNPTVWQQLRDYRGHGRVRVLTLWESTGGTVSLQAGKGGSPSLQWTSSWMSRGDAKRGLLDSLFAVSLAGAANTIRNVTHTGMQGQSAHESAKLATAVAGPLAK